MLRVARRPGSYRHTVPFRFVPRRSPALPHGADSSDGDPMLPTVAHTGAIGPRSRSGPRRPRPLWTECLTSTSSPVPRLWPPEHPRQQVSMAHPLQPLRHGSRWQCDLGIATPAAQERSSLEMTHHDHHHRQRGSMDWDEDDERGHRGYPGDPRRSGGRGSWVQDRGDVWRLGQRRRAGRVCRRWL